MLNMPVEKNTKGQTPFDYTIPQYGGKGKLPFHFFLNSISIIYVTATTKMKYAIYRPWNHIARVASMRIAEYYELHFIGEM